MSYEEKVTWMAGALALVAYGVYLTLVLGAATATPLTEVPILWPMLGTIAGSVVAATVLSTVLGIGHPRSERRRDQRDREITRFGDLTGNAFVVIGALGALLLALFEVEQFWIANLVYLCFFLSAVLSSIAKIVAYRRGLPAW